VTRQFWPQQTHLVLQVLAQRQLEGPTIKQRKDQIKVALTF